MGQGQSSFKRSKASESEESQRCYYEVLGIGNTASEEEIKKAYRRKALELHPDRNYGNSEDATKAFAELQSAYEVLSDQQEKSWYDSHRDEILNNNVDANDDHYERNVRVTTAEDITRMYINFNGHFEFSDAPTGFFSTLRDFFQGMAAEEALASEWESSEPLSYSSFGSSVDTYDEIKEFYSVWSNFSTRKQFSWKDLYRYSDASDRRTRRAMEKENKRSRDEGVKEFNSAVRALVAFIKKKDPRYTPNTQSLEERQRLLRDMATAQASKARSANMAKLTTDAVPEWAKSHDDDNVFEFDNSEDEEQEHFECVVCRKTFKSEKQFQAHEQSKKHLKALRQLLRKMRDDDEELGLVVPEDSPSTAGNDQHSPIGDSTRDSTDVTLPDEDASPELPESVSQLTDSIGSLSGGSQTAQEPSNSEDSGEEELEGHATNRMGSDSGHDSDYAPRSDVEQRVMHPSPGTVDDPADSLADVLAAGHLNTAVPKLGKAKAKRAKKAAAAQHQISSKSSQEHLCNACQAAFPSKRRLFDHIKKNPNHAMPSDKSGGSKG